MPAIAPLDLCRYLPRRFIELAENFGGAVEATPSAASVQVSLSAPAAHLAAMGIEEARVSADERWMTLLMVRCLHLFLTQGPVVAQPGEDLCRDLLDTEIRLDLADVRMPFPVIALELPRAIAGSHPPFLIFLWHVAPERLVAWVHLPEVGFALHQTFVAGQSIEATILANPAHNLPDNEARRLVIQGFRAAINVALVMAHQGFDLEPLSARAARNRKSPDGRLRRLAHREPQRAIVRHLRPRLPAPAPQGVDPEPESGLTVAPHRVKGHWRRQTCGDGGRDRKVIWVQPYWTGREIPPSPPTILYRD